MGWPGEKLLIKLWETLAEKGIGGLLSPWQEKRIGEARAEIRRSEILLLAQAEREAELIRSGGAVYQINSNIKLLNHEPESIDEEGRIEPTINLPEFINNAANINVAESVRNEVNVARAVLVAEDILSNDEQEASDTDLESDWLFTWRDYAGKVSTEELQDLWGRILAGEVKQPGTYSMRTLEFLKGLSKAEAEIISKLARFVIHDRIYRGKDKYFEKEGINFSQLMFLQDIGIMSGVEALGLSVTYRSERDNAFFRPLIANNKIILLEHEDSSKSADAQVYSLTQIGIEVLRLASFEVDEGYLNSVGQDWIKKGFQVKIGDWKRITANSGQYANLTDLTIDQDA